MLHFKQISFMKLMHFMQSHPNPSKSFNVFQNFIFIFEDIFGARVKNHFSTGSTSNRHFVDFPIQCFCI